jgi:hypothetical protein
MTAPSWWGRLFFFGPRQQRQKTAWWRVVTARWEPQEEGMMSIVAILPSVVKPRFIEPVGEIQTSEGDAC